MSMTFEEALEYIYKVVKCREQDKAKCNGCESCPYNFEFGWTYKAEKAIAQYYEEERRRQEIIPAQPERTCVNCGRTANNGGWYADGGTRCPIEEHYALPKDGYCHLWEKRNVTDDDYPERREE